MSAADSISRKQSSLLSRHLHQQKRRTGVRAYSVMVEMAEIESASESGHKYDSTMCSQP